MSTTTIVAAVAVAALAAAVQLESQASEPRFAHMVYFKLTSNSPEAKQTLVDACDKYLSGHEGTVFYSAGILAEDMKRDVNDRDFDVSLHLVFENKAAHDKYHTHPRHLEFINENKEVFAKVRVFDSYLSNP